MDFSYDKSLAPWEPETKGNGSKIRILELLPPPWYLRWVPRCFLSWYPLRSRLAWEPLDTLSNSAKSPTRTPGIKVQTLPYRALSYTWGNPDTPKVFIIVNGERFEITASLALALFHLRSPSQPLRIWIDQICIDQKNNDEKTEQVGHMKHIYRNCEECLVWLGPEEYGSDALMDLFNRMGAFSEKLKLLDKYHPTRYHELVDIQMQVNPQDPDTIEYHAFCDAIVLEWTPANLESLIAFHQRPWFFRAWVLQEFALPPKATFICGHKTIQAETLMVVLAMFTSTIIPKITRTSSGNQKIMNLLGTINDVNTLQPFFSTRQRQKAQRREATDPYKIDGDNLYQILQRICVEQNVQATQGTDMVYGLLGLINNQEQLGVQPIYLQKRELLAQAAFLVEADKSGRYDPLLETHEANEEENATEEEEKKKKKKKKKEAQLMQQLQAGLTYTQTAKAIILSGSVDLLTLVRHVKKDMTLPSWVPDWRSAVRQHFAHKGELEKVDFTALAIAQYLESKNALPSWVPDWRTELKRSYSWLRDEKKAPLFKASANQPLRLFPENDGQVLAIEGYIVDKIEEVGGPWSGGSRADGASSSFPHEDYINYLTQVRQMCLLSKAKGANIYQNDKRRDEAVWRVPIGDIDQDEMYLAVRAEPPCKLRYDTCLAELELQMQVNGLTSLKEYEQRAAEVDAMSQPREADTDGRGFYGSLYRIHMQEMKGKRPFLSSVGYVGMGPSYMRPSDIIVVLSGASVPFIVRPLEEGRFRLLGECYCDGIMDGEIVGKQAGERIILV
jgi:hypothetical protein